MLDSLQKGNRQAVTFVENGNEQRRYIEANPQFKSVTIFDANMHQVHNRQSHQVSQSNAPKQEQKASQDVDADDGKDHHAGKKVKKSKGMAISQ